jgi:hypothetical protein
VLQINLNDNARFSGHLKEFNNGSVTGVHFPSETRDNKSVAGTLLTSPSTEIISERPLAALSSTSLREASFIP